MSRCLVTGNPHIYTYQEVVGEKYLYRLLTTSRQLRVSTHENHNQVFQFVDKQDKAFLNFEPQNTKDAPVDVDCFRQSSERLQNITWFCGVTDIFWPIKTD